MSLLKPNSSNLAESELDNKMRRRCIQVWTWIGILLLAAAALYLAGILANAVGLIVWTIVIVFMLRGPVNWLDSKGVNRTIGTVLAYAMLVAIFGLLVFVTFSPMFGLSAQFEDLAASLPTYIEAFQEWATGLYREYSSILQNDAVNEWVSSVTSSVGGFVQSLASSTASGVVAAGASLANIMMCIGFALVIAFWMLIDLPKLGREAYRMIGDDRKEDAQMFHLTVTRVVGGYLKATLIQCAIIGAACGVMFWILGVPSPAALAVITGIMNIIPIVGPWLGGGLAFVASVITSPIVGVISLIGTIVIQQLVYTFVSPKLMGESVDIHPALTFIALLAGSAAGGALGGLVGSLVGALLSIPMVAIIKSLFVYYFERETGRRIVSEDGVFFKGAAHEEGQEFDPIADATAPMPAVAPPTPSTIRDLTDKIPKINPDDDAD